MDCPSCGRFNSILDERCDCGHAFRAPPAGAPKVTNDAPPPAAATIPLDSLDAMVAVGRRRARAAVAAEVGIVGVGALGTVFPQLVLHATALFTTVVLSITAASAIAFFRWLHQAQRTAIALGRPMTFTPAQAVWAFLIPVVNLFRPRTVMRELVAASDPRGLPLPPTHTANPAPHYRDSARTTTAPRDWRHDDVVASWWWLRLGSFVTLPALAVMYPAERYGRDLLSQGLSLATAILMVRLIRTIDAGEREVARRLAALPPAPPRDPASRGFDAPERLPG